MKSKIFLIKKYESLKVHVAEFIIGPKTTIFCENDWYTPVNLKNPLFPYQKT